MAIVGIDLGTTYSVVAKVNELGKPEILPNQDSGTLLTPSVVFFESEKVTVVGDVAKNTAESDPEHVVQFVKNYMGRSKTWQFFGRAYIPEQISALILTKLRQDAENYLDEPITQAVITVPAIFGDAERTATKEAAKIAGIKVLSIVNEPVAAAISYGFGRRGGIKESKNVLVYDLGGGTFDITVIRISENCVKVLHTEGDRLLGGKLWDDAIIHYVADCFQSKHGADPRRDAATLQDLRSRAEQAKKNLSQKEKQVIVCNHAGQALEIEMTRSKFEALTVDLLDRTKATTEWVMQQLIATGKLAGWPEIDQVLLVGGSSKMPQVAKMMQQLSGQEPKLHDPDLAVAKGAALYGVMQLVIEEQKTGNPVPDDIGVDPPLMGGLMVQVENTCSQAIGIESIDRDDDRLITNRIIIPKNAELPARVTQRFKTSTDSKVVVQIPILQGDDPDPERCERLGEFYITGIPPGLPKGSPIEITIEVDNNEALIRGRAIETTYNTECIFEIRREREIDLPQAKADLPEVE